jgi:hypothetical protein
LDVFFSPESGKWERYVKWLRKSQLPTFVNSYQIIVGGASTFSGGTSAAAPLVAGLIGMINAERLGRNKPAMGFLNPFLYSLGSTEALTDIVAGASKGCDGHDTQTGLPIEGAGVIGNGTGAHWEAVEGESLLFCSFLPHPLAVSGLL